MKVTTKTLAELFGAPSQLVLRCNEWEEGEELAKLVPAKDDTYLFPKDMVRDLNAWILHSTEPLFLFGPTGCGKSSFVKQAANRLGIPLFRMTISQDTELSEIFGHYVLGPNGTEFRYGPAALAAKHDGWLLLDEIGRGSPAVVVGMNGLLEGGSFVIPANGETIIPNANFRVVLTDNTNLAGDESGGYNTANIQDVSVPDRVGMAIEVAYPIDEERTIIKQTLELISDSSLEYWLDQEGVTVKTEQGPKSGKSVTREEFIDAICQVRDMVRSQSRDGGNDNAGSLERTMSVRSLQRWIRYCAAFIGAPNRGVSALHYALSRALTNTCSPSTKVAIHTIVQSVFGVAETLQ